MARGRSFAWVLVLCLLVDAFCVPAISFRRRRGLGDDQLDSKELISTAKESKEASDNLSSDDMKTSSTTSVAIEEDKSNVDDDDDFDDPSPPGGGGSNIFSLLNLASALFPASGSSNAKKTNEIVKMLIQDLIRINHNQIKLIQKRKDIADNVIDIDYIADLKPPPFQKLESLDSNSNESAESDSEESEEDNGKEESVEKESNERGSASEQNTEEDNGDESNEKESNGVGGSNSKQDSDTGNGDDDDNDSDYDEPPDDGDGQGGGILGLLAGLSGDGDSDLGTLLATIGGIVANLSGDGVDINAIIATGLGLFVGLLSEGEQNPGEIIASYLLTSLDTITGGGANNNGAFFGKFISKLVKGTIATKSSETPQQPQSPFWTLKMDIVRALFQFGTTMLGLASSSSANASY